MIIDRRLQVSADQALTGTSLVPSTDVIDLGQDRDIGPGRPMWWVLVFKAAPGGTTPTLTFRQQTDDNAAFSSAADLFVSPVLAAADMALGRRHVFPMAFTNERFLRASYTMGGTSPTSTVDCFLTDQDPANWAAQPDGI